MIRHSEQSVREGLKFPLNIEQVLLTVLPTVFLSSFVRSAFGFGDALIAMPMLVIFIGIDEATPLVALISYTIAILVLIKNWAHADLKIDTFRRAGLTYMYICC